MADREAAVAALLDKQEITELLTRYLRSVDRGDVATLRSCYLPGATEDHGGLFAGPARDYVDSITAALTHPRARTSHNMTNLLIDLDGDVAAAESYCITFARIKADGEYYHSFTGARMIDRLERRDGDPRTWGIAHRQLIWDWNHDAPEAETWMRGLLTPDPSVLRVGDDYYVTFSSFDSYPGLLLWHSRDLVNWQPLAPALPVRVRQAHRVA